MNRVVNYASAFVICLILFIAFNYSRLIDSLVFVVFILSSLYLLFSKDKLPKTKKALEIPEIHNYFKIRTSNYSYVLAALFIIDSIIYSLTTVFLNLRSGYSALILWLISIIALYFITKKFSVKSEDSAVDFTSMQLKIDENKIHELINYINSQNVKHDSTQKNINKIIDKALSIGISEDNAKHILNLYYLYLESAATTLSSSEVDSYN